MMFPHILILDSHQDILNRVKEACTNKGYQLTTLNFCEDIIETIMQSQPDLVVLDFLLYGLNGGELCQQIKSHPLTRHLPVFITSNYPRVLECFGNYGCDEFMAKPFSINQFFSIVDKYLASSVLVPAIH